MASLVDAVASASETLCSICLFDFADCEPTTLTCGHTFCKDDAIGLTSCPLCNSELNNEVLAVSTTIKSLAMCLRALNLGGLRRKRLVSLLELSGSLQTYVPSSSEKCGVCLLDYVDRDAVTFSCGHSCCVKDAKRLTLCRVCRIELSPQEARKVSPLVRSLSLSIRDWGCGRPQLSPKASFRVDEVPESLCSVELIEIATRQGVIVNMCSVAGCVNAASFVCGKCRAAHYCGKVHQQVHWTNSHSNVCSILRTNSEYSCTTSISPQEAPLVISRLTDYHTTGMPAWLQFSFNNRADSWRNIFYLLSQTSSGSSDDCIGGRLCITAEGVAESLYTEVMAVKICPTAWFIGSADCEVIPMLVVKFCFAFHSESRLGAVRRLTVPASHLIKCVQYLQINEAMIDPVDVDNLRLGLHSMYHVSFAVPFAKL